MGWMRKPGLVNSADYHKAMLLISTFKPPLLDPFSVVIMACLPNWVVDHNCEYNYTVHTVQEYG